MSVDPGELYAKIRDIHYDISISSGFDEFKQLEKALESSKSRLKLWQDTWLPGASDPMASPERLGQRRLGQDSGYTCRDGKNDKAS